MKEMEEIELDSINKPSNPNPNQVDVKPTALRTLFFKFASRKEKIVFSLGFLCILPPRSFLNHSCCIIWNTQSSIFHFLWNNSR